MLSSGLRNWQQDNRYRASEDTVYGVYENIGFSVAEEDGGRLFIFMLSGKDEAFDSLEDLLSNQGGCLRNAQVGDVESYLAIFFDDADGRLSGEDMSEVLDYVAGNFRSCGFRTPNVCVKCGAPATKRSFYNGMVQPLCAPCREADKMEKAHKAAAPAAADQADDYDRRRDRGYDDYPDRRRREPEYPDRGREREYEREYEEPRRERARVYEERDYHASAWGEDEPERFAESGLGSAPAGFLGALLGAVAGLVPYIISSMCGFELAALCFLTGIGAIMGYVSFGGLKAKTNALVNAIALSEIFSLVMVIVRTVAANSGDGLSVVFGNLLQLAGLNLLMAGVGALLGVLVSLDTLHKYLLSNEKNRF